MSSFDEDVAASIRLTAIDEASKTLKTIADECRAMAEAGRRGKQAMTLLRAAIEYAAQLPNTPE